MTLATTNAQDSYTGAGNASVYPFDFQVFNPADLVVTVQNLSNVTTVLTLNVDYTVQGLNAGGNPASTGTITLVNAGQAWLTSGNLTTGFVLVVARIVALQQNASIRNQGDFFQESVENALDYLMMAIQQQGSNATTPLMNAAISAATTATAAALSATASATSAAASATQASQAAPNLLNNAIDLIMAA